MLTAAAGACFAGRRPAREANCIGFPACEVHCKTNKQLGPGPDPCRFIALDPVEVDGLPRTHFVFMPCFHCEDVVCPGVSDRRDAEA